MTEPGLCESCRHAHVVQAAASTFYRCTRHEDEPQHFARYPEIPVRACNGFDEGQPQRSSNS